jgi:hypothetical protein
MRGAPWDQAAGQLAAQVGQAARRAIPRPGNRGPSCGITTKIARRVSTSAELTPPSRRERQGPTPASVRASCWHLLEVGGSFDDVAELTVYVVDWPPDKMPMFLEGRSGGRAAGVTPVPPGTLLGVAALDLPDHLVEVKATAIID